MRAFHGAHAARPAGIGFRPIEDEDRDFLLALYASTRADELAPLSWSAEEKRRFLQQQFEFQHRYYQQSFEDADFLLVLQGRDPIGRVYVARTEDEIDLVDIAISIDWRGKGIGSHLLRELIEESDSTGRAIILHVEPHNPAHRLYHRAGFVLIENRGAYDFMRRMPANAV